MAMLQAETRVRAVAKNRPISPQKVRLVIDQIRGKRVNEALAILRFLPQGAADEVARVVRSAAANAEHNNDMDPANLRIALAFADDGSKLKRFTARSRGRPGPIVKRHSHITIVVEELPRAVRGRSSVPARRRLPRRPGPPRPTQKPMKEIEPIRQEAPATTSESTEEEVFALPEIQQAIASNTADLVEELRGREEYGEWIADHICSALVSISAHLRGGKDDSFFDRNAISVGDQKIEANIPFNDIPGLSAEEIAIMAYYPSKVLRTIDADVLSLDTDERNVRIANSLILIDPGMEMPLGGVAEYDAQLTIFAVDCR